MANEKNAAPQSAADYRATAPSQEGVGQGEIAVAAPELIADLASMVRRLSYALKRSGTNDKLVWQSVEFLKKHDLGGSILRADTLNAAPQSAADYRATAPSQEGVGQGEIAVAAPTPRTNAPSCRSEFVASWKDWEGAVCVSLADYERLERELAAAKSVIGTYQAELREECQATEKAEAALADLKIKMAANSREYESLLAEIREEAASLRKDAGYWNECLAARRFPALLQTPVGGWQWEFCGHFGKTETDAIDAAKEGK